MGAKNHLAAAASRGYEFALDPPFLRGEHGHPDPRPEKETPGGDLVPRPGAARDRRRGHAQDVAREGAADAERKAKTAHPG